MNPDSDAGESGCPFCAIVCGEESVDVVCEGDDWLAFFPLEPATPGHTLVIPRSHVPDLWDASPTLAAELMQAVLRVGRAICTALDPEGMNLITSSGNAAEQSVYHLHLHVVPRWSDDGFGRIWPLDSHVSKREERDVAARIRSACADPE